MKVTENRWKTVGELIRSNVAEVPDRTFLRFFRRAQLTTVSYASFARQLVGLNDQLKAHGVEPKDRIVFYLDDILPSTYLTLTCAQFGYVHVMAGSVLSLASLEALMSRCGARHVFTTRSLVANLTSAGISPLVLDEEGEEPEPGSRPLYLTRADGPVEEVLAKLDDANRGITPDDVVRFGLTSGSTGTPKIVSRTHRTALGNNILRTFDLEREAAPPERILLAAGVTHGLGYSQIVAALYLGGEICVTTKAQTHAELSEIRALDPTLIHVPPRYYKSWYQQHLQTPHADPEARLFGPSLKIAGTGGAAPDFEMMKRIGAQGVDIVESYGSNETDIIAIARRGEYRFDGWIGRPPPGVDVKLDADGELLVRSSTMFSGYVHDEQPSQGAFTEDGWYRTGEFAAISEDGKIGIRGRKKDVFNTPDGSNIYPERLERLLEANEAVRQVILIGDQRPFVLALVSLAHPSVEGEGPHGVISRSRGPGHHEEIERVIARVNESVEVFEQVKAMILFADPFPDEIYRTANLGKTSRDRRKTVARYQALIDEVYRSTERR